MEDRVNWRMEHEVHGWILRQEKECAARSVQHQSPILDLQMTRDEIVRSLLLEIEGHGGLFGSSSTPESIL